MMSRDLIELERDKLFTWIAYFELLLFEQSPDEIEEIHFFVFAVHLLSYIKQ